MAEYLIQDSTLTGIANAIRSKTGGETSIAVKDMASVIENISTSEVVTGIFEITEVNTAGIMCTGCDFLPSRFFIHMRAENTDDAITIPESETYTIVTDLAYDGQYTYVTSVGTTGTTMTVNLYMVNSGFVYKPVYELMTGTLYVVIGLYCQDENAPANGIGYWSLAPGKYQWVAIK